MLSMFIFFCPHLHSLNVLTLQKALLQKRMIITNFFKKYDYYLNSEEN